MGFLDNGDSQAVANLGFEKAAPLVLSLQRDYFPPRHLSAYRWFNGIPGVRLRFRDDVGCHD
jgi:hypothetical protein